MRKTHLGICVLDEIYGNRMIRYIMNHYKSQFEVYSYTDKEALLAVSEDEIDVLLVVCSDNNSDETKDIIWEMPVIMLVDSEQVPDYQREGVYIIEKYQEINNIIDEVLIHVSAEVKELKDMGNLIPKNQVHGIYSLSENDYQLAFAATLGSILGEKNRVIIIDIQENSGLKRQLSACNQKGLEELVVMLENDRFSRNVFSECIVHDGNIDYIYPAIDTDNLCEISASTYIKLIQMISQETDYEIIIINFGGRFAGFYEVINMCSKLYLIQKKGGLGQWREYEFVEDLNDKGYKSLIDKIVKIEPPIVVSPVDNCMGLAEQWKWTEFGDMIRGISTEATVGAGN